MTNKAKNTAFNINPTFLQVAAPKNSKNKNFSTSRTKEISGLDKRKFLIFTAPLTSKAAVYTTHAS